MFMRDTDLKGHFKKIYLSYFVVLLVPILVSSFFSWKSTKMIADQSRRIASMVLERRSANLDAIFNELYSIAGTITTNESVQFYIESKHPENVLADAAGKLAQSVRYVSTLNDAISDICVYSLSDSRIVTCSGRYQDDLSRKLLERMGFGGVDMRDFIYTHLTDTAVILETGEVYVMRPILLDMQVAGAVFIRASDSFLDSLLNDDTLLSSWSCIVSLNGNTYPNDSNPPNEANSNYRISHFGDGDVTLKLSSSVSPLTYVVSVPSNTYLAEVNRIVLFIVVYNLLSLAAGGILAYIYAQQNYLPIKRLIKTVGAENTSIESMLREIETRLRQHRTYDAEHTEIIRSRMLLGLLHGDEGADKRILSAHGIDEDDELAVITVAYEDIKGILFDESELSSFEQRDMVNVIIRSITHELIGEIGGKCVFSSIGETTCVLSADDWSAAEKVLNHASEIIEENFGLMVTFGVSLRKSDVSELPDAYRESLHALESALLLKDRRCALYEVIGKDVAAGENGSSFIRDYRQLLSSLMERDYSSSSDYLMRLREELTEWPVSDVKRRARLLAGAAAEFGLYNAAEDTVWRTQDVHDLFSVISAKLSEKEAHEKELSQSELVRRTKEYIDKHYNEYSLDILRISEHIGMSQSHLSREFKRETGMTLTDYIKKHRLNEAKFLLETGNLSIKEIAQRVGYPDPRALNRLFRQTEGLTAANYRTYMRSLRP